MERFNWTTSQIDEMDFFKTIEVLFDDDLKKQKEPLMYIDQIGI